MHALVAFIPIFSFQFEECRISAPREAVIDAVNAGHLYVSSGAGHLRVEGRPGLQQARIRGVACASERSLLETLELTVRRIGNEIRVLINDRELVQRNRDYARLNIIIEVPEELAATIEDSGGDIELSGLGSVSIKDGAGDIRLNDISGGVSIEDNYGEMRLGSIKGDVAIRDGSGRIALSDIEGAVDIRDGSGSINLVRVSSDVAISDGSGDIDVNGVGGNFIVRDDQDGDIAYRRVRGTIRMPPNGRDYSRSRMWLFR